MRLEIRRLFLSRMSLVVYLLAFAPAILLIGHATFETRYRQRLRSIAKTHKPLAGLDQVYPGMSMQQVVERLGRPYAQRFGRRGSPTVFYQYTDGTTNLTVVFMQGYVWRLLYREPTSLPEYLRLLSGIFNLYYLRLGIFFGAVWVFASLFRGQILDKTIHYYLLCPVRREVLMAGKYLAGLLSMILVFDLGVLFQWIGTLWLFDKATLAGYLDQSSLRQLLTCVAVTALGCLGYGSVFTAVGLIFRNPIVPAAAILAWEQINPFLPAALKPLGMIHYLQSLLPSSAKLDQQIPPMISLLIRPGEPARPTVAVIWIVTVSLVLLAVCCVLARRLQVNYATD
jgi:hypothetical protein